MEVGHFDVQRVREHLKNIERELAILKELIETPSEAQADRDDSEIQKLRKRLIDEGFDEELVQLVGTVPLRNSDYKEEIRAVIYERHKRK